MTKLQILIMAAVTAVLLAAPAAAQLIDGRDADRLASIIRGFGSATVDRADRGQPEIYGRIDGTRFAVLFYSCDDFGENCRQIQFRATFAGARDPIRLANAWNRARVFGKSYARDDGDIVIEMPLNMSGGGVSTRNFDDFVDLWRVVLRQFRDHIGDRR